MTMTQFAVNALLAKDNIEENTQMRQTLTNVSGRVVPEMKEQPHKEEYITGYERTVNGRKRIRMCRSQLNEIEQQDKAIQRYRESPENKRANVCNSKRYAWLRDSEKFLQLKCPNPVMVWLKVRTDQPHVFYGLRYTNKLKTEMEVLDEQELRTKYRADIEMIKRNKNIHSKLIEEFQSLNLVDEEDCVVRCLTPSVEAKERINAIVEGIVVDMSKELAPATPQRSHSNAGDTYTAEQLVNTMNNCQNYFVKNVFNINYFSGVPALERN
ncbi:Bro14 [Heliothis virescens ascovirus 3e]|nr:Bro14 [Heliothis virescens ascovirus 3e]ABO37308.1 Bro14 [Heliothis virescens ascovirus 3e]